MPKLDAGATLMDVAARARVSRQTVSNALNAPGRLRPETLARVQAAIEELGYRPDANARGLRTGSSGMIGYCYSARPAGSISTFMDEFLRELTAVIGHTGRHLLLFSDTGEPTETTVYQDLLARGAVDAFVLSDVREHDSRLTWLHEHAVSFVAFGRTWTPDQPGSWVDVDNAKGTAAVVDHLHDEGHRRIGFLGLPETDPVGNDRRAGWERRCRELGLGTPAGYAVHSAGAGSASGADMTARLLDHPEAPTAIVAATDELALGVYALLHERGLSPGRDVAVTGFDDSPLATVVAPALTSVQQPVARVAAELVAMVDNPSREPTLLTPTLVVRASSTGRPASS